MNDDRCYHIPTSDGQTMCSCLDYIMWLRTVIQMQARYISDLERRMQRVPYKVLTPLSVSGRLTSTSQQNGDSDESKAAT